MSRNECKIPRPLMQDIDTDMLHLYVLVDCALLEEEFYNSAIKDKSIKAKSLFDGTPHTESAVAGPLLIQLDVEKSAGFIKTLQDIEVENPAVVWLWGEKDIKPMASNLQKLLFGELENGKKMFFRYYDPRNLEGMLTIFKESNQANKVLQDIPAWAYKKNNEYQYLN